MNQRQFAFAVVWAGILLISLAACAPAAAPQPNATLSPVSLKVVILPFISFAPFWIAQDEGYFKEQALNVELVDMTQQQDTLPALVSGQVDVTSGQVAAGMFNAIARGGKLKLVADKGYIDPKACSNIAVLARKDAPGLDGTLTAASLKGRKLNVVAGTWMEYYAEKLVAPLGLKTSDFEFVNVPSPSQLEALAKGTLDLVAQNEPWVTLLEDAGHKPILAPVSAVMPDSQSAVTLFGAKLLGDNADVGRRFMLAYLKAVRKYNEGKLDSTVKTLSKYTKLDESLLKRLCWPALRSDGTLNMSSVLDFQGWAVARKLSDAPLTEGQIYDSSFVQYAAAQLGKTN